jgi:outer membrane protein assembly factor BamB
MPTRHLLVLFALTIPPALGMARGLTPAPGATLRLALRLAQGNPELRRRVEDSLSAAAAGARSGQRGGVQSHDWPQFLGPSRNGVYDGPALAATWGTGDPRVVWTRHVGQGLSGPVVAAGRVVLFHRLGDQEIVEAFDARTGAPQWRYGYATSYRDDFGFDEGPRAVPVVANGVVYTFGAEGQLHAIDLSTGKRIWSDDTMRHFGVAKGFFGAAGSPLVEDGRVLANIGGKGAGIVAFDATTGKVLWTATSDEASYSSPAGATIAGRRSAVFLTRNSVIGLDPATGSVQFQRPWRARLAASVNVATPLVVGDLVFVSAEYGPGAAVLRVDGPKLSDLWASDDVLSNHYATSVYRDGYLYGFHGRQEFGPSFRAVEFRTGRVRWSQDQFRAGSVTLAGDRLLIIRESGEMILAAASPDAFRTLAHAQILKATVRAFPALADGFLYVRNDDTLVCLDLRGGA